MLDLREQIRRCFQGRVCLMGLGNVEYGDDGFGVHLALGIAQSGVRSPQSRVQTAGEPLISTWLQPGVANGAKPETVFNGFLPYGCSSDSQLAQEAVETARPGSDESCTGLKPGANEKRGVSCLVAGRNPERFLGSVAQKGFDNLVFLDAVEFGGMPGSVILLDCQQMAARFPQVSTHKVSLGVLAKWVEANGTTRAWLLGVQPASLEPGAPLSAAVRTTLELLVDLLAGRLDEVPR